MARPSENPAGVVAAAAFFVGAGCLELALGLSELARPLDWWPLSGVLGRATLHFLLAAGLWQRLALCRSIAMVYCLAALATHGVALGLAWAQAPLRFSTALIASSLYEVPSCALLLPFLRSGRAAALFPRPLVAPPLGPSRG
jgi:hypothetical protein